MFSPLKPLLLILILSFVAVSSPLAEETERLGVKFPNEKQIDGKRVILNGMAGAKFMFMKIMVRGLYLENPTQDAKEVIDSEQIKQLHTHYLTDRISASKMKKAVVDAIEKTNPPELVTAHRADIEKYASWMDQDSRPGLTSTGTYVPGQGLRLEIGGKVKGTIPGKGFAQMYFRTALGDKANEDMKKEYLGMD